MSAEGKVPLYTRSFHPLTEEDVCTSAKTLGYKLSEDEIEGFQAESKGAFQAYSRLCQIPDDPIPVRYPRTPGEPDMDPAWARKVVIKGTEGGILAGKTFAIKDNTAVAGVPMVNGANVLEGFVPDEDATVVTRILDAGGTILGKSTCEYFCFSGNSWTASSGSVPNPIDPSKSSGGSSSGSGSLVARGIVDMAIGGDQGGSIRIPACWCGIVGLKPTWGLVPYTGAIPIEPSLDHLGPMAKTVEDCALMLEAIAGYDDGKDHRQYPTMPVQKFTQMVSKPVTGKKVGILVEGFCNPVTVEVATAVRDAANKLKQAGAIVEEVSVSLHRDGATIWTPIAFEGAYQTMNKCNGYMYGLKGHYSQSTLQAIKRGQASAPNDNSMPLKYSYTLSEHIASNYGNKFYAKARNLTRKLTQAYDKALENYDVLVMPTLTDTPFKLPTQEDPILDVFKATFGMLHNTAPFDATGHPALTVNIYKGTEGKLPIGIMFVGKHFDDGTVLQMGRAFERVRDEE